MASLILAVADGKQLFSISTPFFLGIFHQAFRDFLCPRTVFRDLQAPCFVHNQHRLHIQRFRQITLPFGKPAAFNQIGQAYLP